MKKKENMRKLIKTNQILSEIKLKTEFYEIKAQKPSKIKLKIIENNARNTLFCVQQGIGKMRVGIPN